MAEIELAGQGRVLVRPSGTEPLVRVMVEAPSAEQASAVADRLSEAVRGSPGSPPPPAEGPTGANHRNWRQRPEWVFRIGRSTTHVRHHRGDPSAQ